jgi:hypothetical protein
MSRRNVVAALALVVAVSFAVPALAGKGSPITIAKKALRLSKKADKRSRNALRRAVGASKTANTASANAALALSKLAAAQPEALHAANADHAGAAATLDGFTVLPLTKIHAATGADRPTARAAAPEIVLAQKGALRVYAKCFSYATTSPTVVAEVYVETSQDGAVSSSGAGYLTTSTPEAERIVLSGASTSASGMIDHSTPGDGEFFVFGPEGSALQGHVYEATKVGEPAAGDGAFGPGDGCMFGGRIAAS